MTRRKVVILAVLLLTAAALTRAVMAAFDAIPAARAAGEAGALLGVLALGAALVLGAPRALEGKTAVATGALLVLAGLGAIFPLLRLAYPDTAVFAGNLGGARRQITTDPVAKDGLYTVELGRARDVTAEINESQGPYRLEIRTRTAIKGFEGAARNETPDIFEVELAAGERPILFLERGGGWLGVRIGRPPIDWLYVRIACGLMALVAVLVDVLAARGRGRGLVAGAAAMLALYVIQLDSLVPPKGGAALGAGVLALVGGALWAAIVVAVLHPSAERKAEKKKRA